MNCGYKEKVILYFYGELPAREAGALKAHLAGCASCAGDLALLKGLAARFDGFTPEPPRLSAAALLDAVAREPGFWETLRASLRASALAGACTAAFLLAFQLMGPHGAKAVWTSDIDSNLDSVEYGIYSLEDDMLSSSSGDFDFRCAGFETQKQDIGEKTASAS